jgi:Uma2 family endonuclease
MATDARLTAQDLLRLGGDNVRRELVHGRVIEMPLPGGAHGRTASRIHRYLDRYVERVGGGEVLPGVGFVLVVPGDAERVRGPDVAFISHARLPGGRLPEKFIEAAPDLAVEVLSESNTGVDMQQKIRDYLDAGVRLIWIIARKARTATVYRADGSARLLREQDALDGEDVLPGLSIPLSDIFVD